MAYRSSSTNNALSTARSTTVPASVAANDIIVLIATCDGATNTNGTIPSGFTSFFTDSACTADGQVATCCWKRTSGADSGSYTFTGSPSNSDWIVQAYAFSGRDTTNPPVQGTLNTVNTAAGSPLTINANGVTAVAGDDLLWLSAPDVTATGVGTGHTPPSGYTEQQDAEQNWQNVSGATKDNVSAGATGTVSGTFTMASNTAGYQAVLIRIPAAAGGATITYPELERFTRGLERGISL
jgi:hypothetical protein